MTANTKWLREIVTYRVNVCPEISRGLGWRLAEGSSEQLGVSGIALSS